LAVLLLYAELLGALSFDVREHSLFRQLKLCL
jgi:hypothetical protein